MSPGRRVVNLCVGTLAAGVLAVSGASGFRVTEAGPADGAGPHVDPRSTAVGAYLDYGPDGVARMTEMSRWLGGKELRVGHSYLPGDLWVNIEGSVDFLTAWAQWRQAQNDRMFVLNTPMLERNEVRVSDSTVRLRLRSGAAGLYDRHFRKLAERLVGLGLPDTVIVLGWEMNGTTYAHRCGPDPAAWKAYWQRIVTAMRSVEGQRFRFDFAPSRGRDAVPWTDCYPGDDFVDIVGMDSYDQPPGENFDDQVYGEYGLQKHVDFAAGHGKPISYPEWGLFRNGDNSEYMRRMLEWMDLHPPVYQTITDYCPHGVWGCEGNPEASKLYRSFLSDDNRPLPVDPSAAPGPAEWCFPVSLSDWFTDWTKNRRICVKL
ncbi:glycosyl hydrolase [Streptomyces sp. NPDC008125]|uniref:glycoside hydrolase family 26 protein n=1 Tax=Streptomyces sp. NPDC008125 TaxID=3364811 RepID=UPI0036E4857B